MSLPYRLLAACYLIGGLMTFGFAHPFRCDDAPMIDRQACLNLNLLASTYDGATWPVYWVSK